MSRFKGTAHAWVELADGYPFDDSPIPQTEMGRLAVLGHRASFDVLAPYREDLCRRSPVYEHSAGGASVEEVWGLAGRVAHAALGPVFHGPDFHGKGKG